MKKYLLLLFLVSSSFISLAQTPDTLSCDAPDRDTTELEALPWFGNNAYLENLLDSIGYPSPNSRIVGTDRVRYRIPIKFWVYRNDAGTGGPTDLELRDYIANLNKFYNEDNNTMIGFYMKCEVGYIDDDNHLEIGDAEAWLMMWAHKEPGAINIHITNTLQVGGVHYRARIFGVDAIFLSAATYTQTDLASTIAHEVGHYLELDHTHQYSNRGKCRKEAIDRNRTWTGWEFCPFGGGGGSSAKVCEKTGDLLGDTPADHDLSFNNSCNYGITGQTDPWDDQYETPPTGSLQPDTRNILSYNGDRGCRDIFSRLQIAVMIYSIERGKSSGNKSSWKDIRGEYDDYETDNNSLTAQPVVVGETQERNFHQQHVGSGSWSQCDVDWARFDATCNGTFTVQTSAMAGKTNANTRITLFNAALTQLAQNDDISTSNLFSSVSFNFVSGQTYFIRVENMSSNVTGYYNLQLGPQYTITGSATLCNSGIYSVDNLPAGASVTWSASPGIVQPGCNPCSTTTVTQVNSGITTLTATVTSACFPSPLVLTRQIAVGSPYIQGTVNGPTNAIASAQYYFNFSTNPWNAAITNINWRVPNTGGWSIINGQGTAFTTIQIGQATGAVEVDFDDACGQTWSVFKTVTVGEGGDIQPLSLGIVGVTIFPNPAEDIFIVSLSGLASKMNSTFIKQVKIINKMGLVVQNLTYNDKLKSRQVNIAMLKPDMYTVQVYDNKTWHSVKLIKN